MLTVLTFKYRRPTYRTVYTGEHVAALREMVARHYSEPHRFVCVTDDASDVPGDIETYPLWPDHFNLVNPSHPTARPNCYPRLKLFSSEMRDIFGERFVSLDLDMVIVDDLRPLWNRPEDFVIYDARGDDHYNGSMFMMTAGARAQVWDTFDSVKSPQLTTRAKMRGSDQAWIRYCLSPDAATWTNEDGVHAYLHVVRDHPDRVRYRHERRPVNRNIHVPSAYRRRSSPNVMFAPPKGSAPGYSVPGGLPPNARMVIFAGEYKPWDPRAWRMSPWIRDHYPGL